MLTALAGKPPADFSMPETVVAVSVDPATGYPATPDCPVQRDEFYIIGTEPGEYCPKHGGGTRQPSAPFPGLPPSVDGRPKFGADLVEADKAAGKQE
jgi:membrane carboxypeptidase/penicillin-binding protein